MLRSFFDWLFRRKRGVEVRGMSSAEAYGFRNEAERRLGMRWRGRYVLIRATPGEVMSNHPPWLGRDFRGEGIATGLWSPGRITYYTTNNQVRPETGVHEWAHEILHTNKVPPADHHRIMREHGIP